MSFSGMFGSPAAPSPSVLGLQTDSPAGSPSFGSPRNGMMRKKRKQAKLVNPARSFDFSLDNNTIINSGSGGFDSFNNSGFNAASDHFLAELSPQASPAMTPETSPQNNNTSNSNSNNAPMPCAGEEDSASPSTSLASITHAVVVINAESSSSTTPNGTSDREASFTISSAAFTQTQQQQQELDTSPLASTKGNSQAPMNSPSSFAADGSPIEPSASMSRILSPIDNTVPTKRVPVSPINKSYWRRSLSPLGKGSPLPLAKNSPIIKVGMVRSEKQSATARIFSRGSDGSTASPDISHLLWKRDVSNTSIEDIGSTPQKQGSIYRGAVPGASGFYNQPPTPGTPDSEREVEGLTQSATTFEVEEDDAYFDDDNNNTHLFHNTTPDRSATIGPSPGRTMFNPLPEVPSTPAPAAGHFSAFETPARSSGLIAQTPRSIMRPLNTPATGNSVRFNSVTYFKVIERIPEFHASVSSPQESLGEEGTTPLGIEPLEKFEVPMLEPTSSDEELDFQPTHHNNTLDSIDSDGFDDEVERNTLANSQTTTDPLNGSSITEDGTHQYLTDNSLEATTQWLVNFVSEKNQLQVRSVSDSTQRTVSSASLSPLDLEEPIRHTSPLNPPCEDEGDVSNLDNLNNSSEWVVPGDLSFGNDTLPRLDGASFSIAGMVDPDATGATVRGIAPRRPLGLPGRGEVPAIFKTASSPTKDDEMTPIAPMRTRLAASKYVSTTPIKGTSSSPSATPRLGTSPRGSPPALFGSGVRHNPIEESVPMLAISSPVPSPGKVSPVLPSVSEDEEHEHSSTEVEIKPKGPLFGSLTRSRPSAFPVGLGIGRRRPRSVFDEDDDDSHSDASPTKPILDGKAVSSLTGDMSKLSLVDLSGNASASKLSFLDRTSDSSGVLSPAAGGNMSNTSDSSTGSTNATAALLGAQGNALIGAHAEYAQSLEQQIAKLHSVLAACQAELSARDAMVNKFLPMRDDIIRMQEEMKAKAKENKELRAKLSSAEQSQAATKEQLESVEGERAQLETRVHTVEHETNELKAHLAEAEHAKEELQAEVDALHAGQPSRNYKDESEDLHEQLKFAEDELAFARSQLERTADEAANAREELEATKGELQASQDECGHLRADLEAAHDECERLGADLDTTRSELDAARSSSTAAASDLEDKLLAARQEIDEFKAQLRYVHETTDDLKHALHEAHDEADALRAQLADAKTATSDTQAELHETRDKCTSLESELETVHGTVDDLRADMDAARADYDHVRAEADHEALARADAERAVRSLEDKVKRSELALAEATAEVLRLEDAREHDPEKPENKDKDRRIKQLEAKLRRLADEREMMNVAVNSAQMETEFFKRRLSTLESANSKPRPLRAMKQTPPGTAPLRRVAT